MKNIFWFIEDVIWGIRCSYNYWLHGPYGLAKVIERIPFRYLIKYMRKYGATIGSDCRFERGVNLHRSAGKKPFENLVIGNGVYLGHNIIIDLTEKVEIKDKVYIGARSQIWTHAGFFASKNFSSPDYREKTGRVVLKECAIIYSNVVISPGVVVEEMARVAAGSVVNRSVKAYAFVKGLPAKQ